MNEYIRTEEEVAAANKEVRVSAQKSILDNVNLHEATAVAGILRESKQSILKFLDYFLPHHVSTDGVKLPPASVHAEYDDLLRGSVGYGNGQGWYNLLAILPRGIGKSTIGNLGFSIWASIFAKKSYIIIISATEKSISEHFNAIKDEIKNNELLHLIGVEPVPSTEGGVDNSTNFDYYVFDISTGKKRKVRISAYTATNFPRGLKNGAKRPDLGIIDDFERAKKGNKAGVESKAYRDEIQKIFESEIVFSGFSAKSMQIVFLGTIMHEGQLLYNIYKLSLKDEYFPKFKCVKYAMIENYGTPDAYSIWPEKMSLEEFNQRMLTATKQGTETVLYNELLSQPTSPENQIFKREDFRYFRKRAGQLIECDTDGKDIEGGVRVMLSETSTVISTDLAFTQKERSDYTAFSIAACDNDENLFILDIAYNKWNTYAIVDKANELVTRYNPIAFGVESNAGGKPIIDMMEKELRNNPNFNGIISLKATGISKEDRIINKLQLPYKQGKVFHLYDAHYIPEYEYQVLSVARDGIKSQHDDLVDAVSYTYDLIDEETIYNANSNHNVNNNNYEVPYAGNSYV